MRHAAVHVMNADNRNLLVDTLERLGRSHVAREVTAGDLQSLCDFDDADIKKTPGPEQKAVARYLLALKLLQVQDEVIISGLT